MEMTLEAEKRSGTRNAMMHLMAASLLMASLIGMSSGGDVILTFRQEGKDFDDAYHGLKDELLGDFDMVEHILGKECSAEQFAGIIRTHKPKLVVLMDNTAISLFRKYQSTLPADTPSIPVVTIMGVMIKDAIADLPNACGISYEIPIVTSIVSLRFVLGKPIRKVGVVHREFFTEFLERDRTFCMREGIEIISAAMPNKDDSFGKRIETALKQLERKEIDALWVPNDNVLLRPDIIKDVWMRMVSRYRLPVVVGVEVLVNPRLNFGTFAVLPDHVSMGSQAAAMVYEIRDNNWKCKDNRVDPPLAVYKIINLSQAKKWFNVSEERLKTIDKKLK